MACASLGIHLASQAQFDPKTAHVHHVLAGFRKRGQVFVETFPPLSYLLDDCEFTSTFNNYFDSFAN